MPTLSRCCTYLDSLLQIGSIRDSSYNGLQVEGRPQVKKIVTAVDAGLETFEQAAQKKADLVIVHHGLFWKSATPCCRGAMKKRLALCLQYEMSVYAAHLPLDLHPTLGNNAGLCRLIGATSKEPMFIYDGRSIGFLARFKNPTTLATIEKKLTRGLDTICTVLPAGPRPIRTVGIMSGAAGLGHFAEAVERKADLFVSGEPFDLYHQALDAEVNVIFAGHHASEIMGVQALASRCRQALRVEAEFIDIPTGL